MGKILVDDFTKQKNNLIRILFVAILAAATGFAFQAIYECVSIVLTAGISIIYFNSFFDLKDITPGDDDKYIRILHRKLQVRSKYVEIVILAATAYVVLYITYVIDSFDKGLFNNPTFSVLDNLRHITLYPIVFIVLASLFTMFLFTKNINKAGFIGLAVLSILVPYGVYLLEFFFKFSEKDFLMSIIPSGAIFIAFLCYIISLMIVIRKK